MRCRFHYVVALVEIAEQKVLRKARHRTGSAAQTFQAAAISFAARHYSVWHYRKPSTSPSDSQNSSNKYPAAI